MNFMEAWNELKARKCIIRDCWRKEDGSYEKYLELMRGVHTVFQVILKSPVPNAQGQSVNVGNYLFMDDDFDANDWSVID